MAKLLKTMLLSASLSLSLIAKAENSSTPASKKSDKTAKVETSKAPASNKPALSKERFTLGISQIVEHPSLDEVRKGTLDYLEANGFKDRIDVEYLNAQGNMGINAQIAKKLLGKRPNAILAIGTPAAQAVINKNNHTPVVFTPISDPVGARLAKSWDKPGGIATGTSDKSPIIKQIELIKEIHPQTKKIAILYNPGEANSVSLVEQFKEACKKLNLIPEDGPVQNTTMVFATASSVKADAIYVPTDNTVVSAIESVIKAGIAKKIPVFTAESESVAKGALASLAVNYYKLGSQTGEMLAQILEKKSKPANMPVQFQKEFELHINMENAEKMGANISKEILARAVRH